MEQRHQVIDENYEALVEVMDVREAGGAPAKVRYIRIHVFENGQSIGFKSVDLLIDSAVNKHHITVRTAWAIDQTIRDIIDEN